MCAVKPSEKVEWRVTTATERGVECLAQAVDLELRCFPFFDVIFFFIFIFWRFGNFSELS